MTCPMCAAPPPYTRLQLRQQRLCRAHSRQYDQEFTECGRSGPCSLTLPRSYCKFHIWEHDGAGYPISYPTLRYRAWLVIEAASFVVGLALIPLLLLALNIGARFPRRLRARWLRVVRPIDYMFHSHVGPSDPRKGRIMPGLAGESYLTLCAGSEGVRDLIAAGDVLVTTESYDAPAVSTLIHYHMWPNDSIEPPGWQRLH